MIPKQVVFKFVVFYGLCVVLSHSLVAENVAAENPASTNNPLPSPLTLEFVLSQPSDLHPQIQAAIARVDYSQAQANVVDSETDLNISLLADVRYIEPPLYALDKDNNDSSLRLFVRKNLYDFGRSSAAVDAAQSELEGKQWLLTETKNQHVINLMAAFFDVLLADLMYLRDNEIMTVAYLQYDRTRMRNELGMKPNIEVLEKEKYYQSTRSIFYATRAKQKVSRAQLANLMNRPGELSTEVAEPRLTHINEKLDSSDALIAEAMKNNPYLHSLSKQVFAAQKRIKSARADSYPILKGEIEVSEYARTSGNYNDYEAALILDVPLWTGDAVKANTAKHIAVYQQISAKLNQEKMRIRQAVIETRLLLDVLKIERQEKSSLIDFRDLYLDRSRALYEMEVKTDLGDSMAKVSDARFQLARVKFKTALALARLNALLGRTVYSPSLNEKVNEK